MSVKAFVRSLLVLSMTSSAMAQGPQKPQLQYALNGAPLPAAGTAATATASKPLPKLRVLVSAFRPFGKGETNMAMMVAESIRELSKNDYRYNNLLVDTVDLDVIYSRSSEDLIQKIRSIQTPDLIIGIGQGSTKGVMVETGADSEASRIADIRGSGRYSNFPGLSDEVGFNFPVQDMYCGVAPEIRRKVSISYKGGSFVCNDLAYHMGNFVKPKSETDRGFDSYIAQLRSQYENKVRNIEFQLKNQLEANRLELERINKEEATARAEHDQRMLGVRQRNAIKKQNIDAQYQNDLRAWEADEARIRAEEDRMRREGQQYQASVERTSNGGQVTVYRGNGNNGGWSTSSYGPPAPTQSNNYQDNYGSQNNYPSQNLPQSRRKPYADYSSLEPDLPFPTKANDQSKNLEYQASAAKSQANNEFQNASRRVNELREVMNNQGAKSRFVFIYVLVFDGVAYQPKYRLLGAACLVRGMKLPSGQQWIQEESASQYLGQSISSLRTKARAYIAQTFKEFQRAEKANGAAAYPSTQAPEVCEQPGGPDYQEEILSWEGKRTGKFRTITPPPKGRYAYAVEAYAQKAELKEMSESNSYASTILAMVNAAVAKGQEPVVASLPLPTFKNDLRMPRGESERQQAIATLKSLGYGYNQVSQVARVGEPGKFDTVTKPIPPMMDAATADCYADVLKKMGQDQKEDRAAGPRKW